MGLNERTDVIASSARLIFHDTEAEHLLPAGTAIIQVYDRAQFGLLLLGAPGAGKTTLLLDLVLELLRRAETALRRFENKNVSTLPAAPDEQEKLAKRLGYKDVDLFAKEYRAARETIHALYDGYIKAKLS